VGASLPGEEGFTSVSFTIPLAAELDAAHAIVFASASSAEKNIATTANIRAPQAPRTGGRPRYFCAYTASFFGGGELGGGFFGRPDFQAIRLDQGAGVSGAVLEASSSVPETPAGHLGGHRLDDSRQGGTGFSPGSSPAGAKDSN